MKAVWNGAVLAASDDTVVVAGTPHFHSDSLNREHFADSATHTTGSWKGEASYYNVVVGGEANADAAWYYPSTLEAAKNIEGFIAFWKGVEVTE